MGSGSPIGERYARGDSGAILLGYVIWELPTLRSRGSGYLLNGLDRYQFDTPCLITGCNTFLLSK